MITYQIQMFLKLILLEVINTLSTHIKIEQHVSILCVLFNIQSEKGQDVNVLICKYAKCQIIFSPIEYLVRHIKAN